MKKLQLFLFLFCIVQVAFSSSVGTTGFRRLDMRNGLSNNSVYNILKDSRGFMWFSTASGLNRYDGYTFKVFRSIEGDSLSLPDNFIDEITEWENDTFWVKTARGYVLYDANEECFHRDARKLAELVGSKGIPDKIYVDKEKRLWIYVQGEGCYRYKSAKGGKPEVALVSFADHRLPVSGLTAISECDEGILLLFDSGRLVCIDSRQLDIRWELDEISKEIGLNRYEHFSMFVDADGDIWIYGTSGIWYYNLEHRAFVPSMVESVNARKLYIHDVKQNVDGQVWLATDNHGILCIDKKTGKRTEIGATEREERSLPHNAIYSLYADSAGVMWVGTYKKGVAYYAESTYKFELEDMGDITFIEEGSNGDLWLGTNDKGIIVWNPESGVRRRYDTANGRLSSDAVVSLLQAKDGTLWAGTFRGGLACIKGERVVSYHPEDGGKGLAGENVWSLAEDAKGNIWIATLGAGLQCLHPDTGTFETYNMDNSSLSENYLASICMWDSSTLLVGTATKGVDVVDLSSLRIRPLPGLEHYSVNHLFADSRGLLWIAAREGIILYDYRNACVIELPFMDHLTGMPVSSIVEDEKRHIWLTVSNRIINLRISIGTDGRYQFAHHVYDSNDGVQNCDFNLRSVRLLKDGTIAAGGLYGINLFHPENIRYNHELPEVMFSDFLLFNEPVEVGKDYDGTVILPGSLNTAGSVRLRYSQNVFSVFFATDNYVLPEKTSYTYLMEGFSKDWLTLPAGVNNVTFTNLAPGKYTLHVRAVNNGGYASPSEAHLKIVVYPPFWRSIWAYGLYVLLLVAMLVYTRHRILKRERERFRVQQIEREAAKNEEINQMKFRFFTNISHELRTPLTLIISPLEGLLKESREEEPWHNRLLLMYRNAQRLLGMVNQLLDFRKGEMGEHRLLLSEGDIVAYLQSVCNSFLLLADKKQIRFSFFAGIESYPMAFDADKIGKVMMNLLSNAFKFTPEGGRVNVMLEYVGGISEWMEIKVSDTGIGISDEDKEHIFERFYQARQGAEEAAGTGIGLSLVRDFVTLHDGEIKVFDNIGQGTVFVVRIPVRHTELQSQSTSVSKQSENSEETEIGQPKNSGKAETGQPEGNELKDVPTVLVVDDNEDFRTFMYDSLDLQYRVLLASDGREAWEMLQGEKLPDLVISDVMMPGMDGNELCRLIKQEKRTAHLPVILLTARQATESRLEGLQTGADDYVTKPFNMDILSLRIRKLIELSRFSQPVSGMIDPEPSSIVITSLDEKLIEKAIKYVEDNMSRAELSVEELSRELGMSRVHLYKKLLQITGKTPIEFIRVIRLKRAAQLLRESQLHVSEVAFEVGFNNPKYFSRYFKEEFGVLPSVYQEKEGK